MRRPGLGLLMLLVAVAGCAPGNDGRADAPPVPADASAQRAPSPPRAHGKIAADQVGKLSPVPAFEGGGAGWDISIHAIAGLRHDVRLRRGAAQVANGTVRYRESPPGMHRLEGTLYGVDGDRGMHIELRRGDCTRPGGQVQAYGVEVVVDGMARLRGCGELALP